MCLMPFACRKSSNFVLTKQVPLSVTIVSGNPNLANKDLNSSMTAVDVAEAVLKASIHLL